MYDATSFLLEVCVSNVLIVVLASLSFHSVFSKRSCDTYTPPGFTDKYRWMGISAMEFGVRRLVWNFFATQITPGKIDTVKVQSKFAQMLMITYEVSL